MREREVLFLSWLRRRGDGDDGKEEEEEEIEGILYEASIGQAFKRLGKS